MEASEDEPDLDIQGRVDLQGVEATGSIEAVEALRSVLREELFDVVLRRKAGWSCLDAEFPWDSKRKLDEYRRSVVPTVQKHHYYKACGGHVSSAVDMAEKLLLQGCAPEEVEGLFKQTIEPYLPYEGSEIDVEHVKLSGQALSLGKGVIESYDEESRIKYVREMRSDGVYDGLEVEKEAGDRAVTETTLGARDRSNGFYLEQAIMRSDQVLGGERGVRGKD